jgi:hypothetical protein
MPIAIWGQDAELRAEREEKARYMTRVGIIGKSAYCRLCRYRHNRHAFAVATLLRWYREGVDPNCRLIHLATFLGHVDPNSTAVYLTITEDLLYEAAQRFQVMAPKGGMR